MPTVLDLITADTDATTAEANAVATVAADKAKLTADEQAAADATTAHKAAADTLDGALAVTGPVQTGDRSVYEVIGGVRRVFVPADAGAVEAPTPAATPAAE